MKYIYLKVPQLTECEVQKIEESSSKIEALRDILENPHADTYTTLFAIEGKNRDLYNINSSGESIETDYKTGASIQQKVVKLVDAPEPNKEQQAASAVSQGIPYDVFLKALAITHDSPSPATDFINK